MAEDDEDDRIFIGDALARCPGPPDVRFVVDGSELLTYLRRQGIWSDPARSPHPDLVLLDLNMPRMDGREALRLLKADPALRATPVVVLTTSDAPRDARASYEAGANAFVTKPSTVAALGHALAVTVSFWSEVATPCPAPQAPGGASTKA